MAKGNGAAESTATKSPRWRRIPMLLRDRDWLGIAIELAVVTVGVLLAFQIDQWAQDRRQAREERQFLDRMWHETAEAMEETEWAMTLHARFRQEFIEGINALDNPAALARLAATPNVGCRAAVMPSMGFNNTGFQELSASGRLNIVSDPGLRGELRDVVAAQATADAQRQTSQTFSMDNQRALDPYFILRLDRTGERTCRMDWLRLSRDPIARNALVRSLRQHNLNWTRRGYLRDKLAIAHNHIACLLRKLDCRSDVRLIFRSPPRYDNVPAEARDDVARSAALYNGT
jgi:hypothetical protein